MNYKIENINPFLRIMKKDTYVDEFLNGNIWFSSLESIRKNGIKEVQENPHSTLELVDDPFDGVQRYTKIVENSKIHYQAQFHPYTDVLCFYEINSLHFNKNGIFNGLTDTIQKFGEHSIFIYKPVDFLILLVEYLNNLDLKLNKEIVLGKCNYVDLKPDTDYSFFDKNNSFKGQEEFRIGVFNKDNSERFIINLGNLHDIAIVERTSFFNEKNLKLLNSKVPKKKDYYLNL